MTTILTSNLYYWWTY